MTARIGRPTPPGWTGSGWLRLPVRSAEVRIEQTIVGLDRDTVLESFPLALFLGEKTGVQPTGGGGSANRRNERIS